jgi:hypothetical protein
LAHDAFVEDALERLGDVLVVEVAVDVGTVAVDGEGFVLEELGGFVVADDGLGFGLAVDFVGGDVDEVLDLVVGHFTSLQEDVGAVDVVLGELERVAE